MFYSRFELDLGQVAVQPPSRCTSRVRARVRGRGVTAAFRHRLWERFASSDVRDVYCLRGGQVVQPGVQLNVTAGVWGEILDKWMCNSIRTIRV